jgi:hypothetical protein
MAETCKDCDNWERISTMYGSGYCYGPPAERNPFPWLDMLKVSSEDETCENFERGVKK